MKLSRFVFNLFSENTFILWNEEKKEAAIVDPGMEDDIDRKKVMQFIEENELTVKMVLLTHQHVDHVCGVGWIVENYGCPVYGHKDDVIWGEKVDVQAEMFNLPYAVQHYVTTDYVTDGDVLELNGESIEVRHTPGHSSGGVIYYLPESGFALTGDTIFQMSIGRTDIAHGNFDNLINSIKTKVFTLPEDTVLCPGHGGLTTVGEERSFNPFLKEYR